MKWNLSRKQVAYIFIALVVTIILIGFFDTLQRALFGFTGLLEGYVENHTVLGPIFFILFAAGSVLLGPVTSSPLVPSAVIIWGTETVFVYLLLGWLIGNVLAYAIGYYFGFTFIRKIVSPEDLMQWEIIIKKHITWPYALLFRIATPSETGYIFGTVRYDFIMYLFVTLLAEFPFAYILIYSGKALIEATWLSLIGLLLLWLFIISISALLLRRQYKKTKIKDSGLLALD